MLQFFIFNSKQTQKLFASIRKIPTLCHYIYFCLFFFPSSSNIFHVLFLSFNFTDDVAYLSSPGYEFRGSREARSGAEWEDDERQTDPLIGERWSSATLKVLSSMPSRTIGESSQRPRKILM